MNLNYDIPTNTVQKAYSRLSAAHMALEMARAHLLEAPATEEGMIALNETEGALQTVERELERVHRQAYEAGMAARERVQMGRRRIEA